MNNLKQRGLSVVLSIVLVLSNFTLVFASADKRMDEPEKMSSLIDNMVEESVICHNIQNKKNMLGYQGKHLKSCIPKEAENCIEMYFEDKIIKVSLSDTVKNETGIITSKGTMIYGLKEDSAAIGVQQEEGTGGNESLRVYMVLKDKFAPTEYSFKYHLPTGYKIIELEDFFKGNYYQKQNGFKTNNSLIVITDKNEPVTIIEKPWAKDKNGNTIETFYKVEGDNISQTFVINKRAEFPIIGDPGHSTVTKYTKFIEHKRTVKKLTPAGQGKGVILDKGDGIGYSPEGGGTIDVSLSVGANYKAVSFGVSLGYTSVGERIGYYKEAKKKGRYILKVNKAIEYDVYEQRMKWREGGTSYDQAYGRISKNEETSVDSLELALQPMNV